MPASGPDASGCRGDIGRSLMSTSSPFFPHRNPVSCSNLHDGLSRTQLQPCIIWWLSLSHPVSIRTRVRYCRSSITNTGKSQGPIYATEYIFSMSRRLKNGTSSSTLDLGSRPSSSNRTGPPAPPATEFVFSSGSPPSDYPCSPYPLSSTSSADACISCPTSAPASGPTDPSSDIGRARHPSAPLQLQRRRPGTSSRESHHSSRILATSQRPVEVRVCCSTQNVCYWSGCRCREASVAENRAPDPCA